ncbi:MAG TPA: asparagine synthase (glutamine-hydrolyzing) [Cyclobacteriaceae bacterium]|nr:asparagine synthase (glutamine-hydrolyzing) [Cyclobacteriaceae bacterium]
MCGITGIFAFNLVGKFNKIHVTAATMALEKRGPDFQDIYIDEWVGLGHRRLSIIDTSAAGNQPMWDDSGRYCIVYNGEIFNYQDLKLKLIDSGVTFHSNSDTEVLLRLYIKEKEQCLNKLNGFFSFCIYDKTEQSFFVARDRYGVKPLLYVFDEDKFIFASEMKSILKYGIEKDLDYTSLYTFLQLNYIPAPVTIFKNVKKLLPGHYLKISYQKVKEEAYYEIPLQKGVPDSGSYDDAKEKLKDLLDKSVQRRLISDVPLGAFLSGGIDSSVITALASKHKPDLHTFSIGYRDEKFFDETEYAQLIARHFKTDHTVFSLSNEDLYSHLHSILNYIDEPFADSSAIAVYILSKETRKHATVALSGDGADELLAGYNKHSAFLRSLKPGWKEKLPGYISPLMRFIPQSRNNPFSNKVRQAIRFNEGMKLELPDRYWRWAGYVDEPAALTLLNESSREKVLHEEYLARKKKLLQFLSPESDINDLLLTDTTVVLPNDMLAKVDLMSMANSLEVRTPFLDYELVNFIFGLPGDFKINKKLRKRILQDAFRDILPHQLYNRPKKGFEVPLLKWFRNEMKTMILDDLLSDKLIQEQGIFNPAEVKKLRRRLFSANPGDIHARIWGLIVFQSWWKKNIS